MTNTNFENMDWIELAMEKCYWEQELAKNVWIADVMLVEIEEAMDAIKKQANEEEAKQEEEIVIEVFHEPGYKWSVYIQGEDESIITNVNKADAMVVARQLKKETNNAVINEQKLTKKQKSQNISFLHQTTEIYHDHYRYL